MEEGEEEEEFQVVNCGVSWRRMAGMGGVEDEEGGGGGGGRREREEGDANFSFLLRCKTKLHRPFG